MFFQYGLGLVLIKQILIGFDAILEKNYYITKKNQLKINQTGTFTALIKIATSIAMNSGEVTTEEGSEDGLEAQSEDTAQLIKGESPNSLQTIEQVRY